MKEMFWNSRGLADLAKHNYLALLSKKYRLDFLAIFEMGRDFFSKSNLRHLSGGINFLWHIMLPRGRSGGMILGVNPAVLDVGAIDEEGHCNTWI
jgi:hypothetical protein